jgi:hypothetical protein
MTSSTIRDNSVGLLGAGIYNRGMMTITSSTLSANRADGQHDGEGYGDGGGIYNGGSVTLTNSTLSSNVSSRSAGGVANVGSLTVTHSTLSDNIALEGGGFTNRNNATLDIGNTVLKAGTAGANIFNSSSTVTSHGYNLSSDDGSGFLTATGDQISTDPLLGPLQHNGGPTVTHELLTGSPAINAGDPNFVPPPLYDQRGLGYDRVVGGRIDIGAFEVQP